MRRCSGEERRRTRVPATTSQLTSLNSASGFSGTEVLRESKRMKWSSSYSHALSCSMTLGIWQCQLCQVSTALRVNIGIDGGHDREAIKPDYWQHYLNLQKLSLFIIDSATDTSSGLGSPFVFGSPLPTKWSYLLIEHCQTARNNIAVHAVVLERF